MTPAPSIAPTPRTTAARTERLLVIVPDRLSALVEKGEVTDRYYNPGDLFREVHIAMTNDDRPDPAKVQRMVGSARLHLHNMLDRPHLFRRSLGWSPLLLKRWARQGVALAANVKPALVRCHGAHLNAYLAARIKAELGVPYVVSLHTKPDDPIHKRSLGVKDRIVAHRTRRLERYGLRHADLVLPVYQSIVPYLERVGVRRYEVCYNVLNPRFLSKKTSYALHDPVRVISVGRQIPGKDISNLILAVAMRHNVTLTVIGDGPFHAQLVALAADAGAADRVVFRRAVPNDELTEALPEHDIFAAHSEYWEMPKAVLEPLLSGLPVIMNRQTGRAVPELTDDICVLVEDSPNGYGAALDRLIADHAFRESLGRRAYSYARARWSPERTEAAYVDVYRRILGLTHG